MNEQDTVAGERTVARVTRAESRSVRLQRRLVLLVVGGIGTAVLTWYYHRLGDDARTGAPPAAVAARAAAASEMKLPALDQPRIRVVTPAPAEAPADVVAEMLGAAPAVSVDPAATAGGRNGSTANEDAAQPPKIAVAARQSSRSSPVLVQAAAAAAPDSPSSTALTLPEQLMNAALPVAPATPDHPVPPAARNDRLGDALVPTVTKPAEAALVPSRRWLLPKGASLDCTLQTAIDSTLAGLTTCVLATDVFGSDGRVILLERGTTLVGETVSDVRAGQSRVAVLWSEARTPNGVTVELMSPGTDPLGRAGVPGAVDSHLRDRFGAAVLLSVIDGGISAFVAHQQGSTGVIYNAQGTRDIGTEALRNTIGIPPTIQVAAGSRIQILVARNIDFRGVYRLVRADVD